MINPYEAYAAILGDDLTAKTWTADPIPCTDECKQRRAEWIKASAEYLGKWTKVCRECRGKGGHVYYDDPGVSDCSLPGGAMPFSELCEKCLEKGICPRCGKLAWFDDEYEQGKIVCPHCGWTEGNSEHSMPEQPECVCYEEYLP